MMPRKKRRTILIVIITLLIVILTATLVFLYIRTDMFKSSQQLFTKYIGKNVENLETIYQTVGKSEYQEMLQQNKYTTTTEIKLNHTENIGTTSESTQNSVNQLRLKINGQIDKNAEYNYEDISLVNNNDRVMEIEYLKNQDTQSIRFSDLFAQFITSDNLLETFKNMNSTQEISDYIPDEMQTSINLEDVLSFSEEEKQTITTKYIEIINKNVSKDRFSKQSNQDIQINNKQMKANAYVLKLTKEELNNIFLAILEQLKQDEIILSKIDNIEELMSSYNVTEINLRDEFIDKIDNIIDEITKNNIGQDEAKIIVYENEKNTVKTVIQNPDYEVEIDMIANTQNPYINISYNNMIAGDKKEREFVYQKSDETTDFTFENTVDGETKQYNISNTEKINGNHCDKTLVAKFESDSDRVEATINQSIDIVNSFTNEISLNDENNINLTGLDEETSKTLLGTVETGFLNKINEVITTAINVDDFQKIFKAIGLIQETQEIQSEGITETEKTRFNSKFEILQGDNLEGARMLNLLNAIKENLVSVNVVSPNQIELKLDKSNSDEEASNKLSTFLEQNERYKYSVKVVYDEETGLASSILVTVSEE